MSVPTATPTPEPTPEPTATGGRATDGHPGPDALAALERRLDEQARLLARQQAELDALRALTPTPADEAVTAAAGGAVAPAPSPPAGGADLLAPPVGRPVAEAAGPAHDVTTDRRALLRRFGAAAAGAVTGGAALSALTAGPAAAANGDAVTVGQAKTGTLTTSLIWSGSAIGDTGPAVLLVKDGSSGVSNALGATVVGYRTGGGADGKGLAGVNTSDGIGVYGSGDTGVAGVGTAGGIGVRAEGGYAVTATSVGSAGVGAYVDVAGTHLVLKPGPPDPFTAGGTRLAGSVVTDAAGTLWFCTAGGAPGTWRKLAGPATAGQLHVLAAPKRVFDSRAGYAPANVAKGPFTNQTKVVDAKGNGSGVPAGATAVLVNLAVTNTVNGGYGALWANGVADPGTSSINWSASGTSTSNSVVTAVDAAGLLLCKIAGTADVVIDVVGYYR